MVFKNGVEQASPNLKTCETCSLPTDDLIENASAECQIVVNSCRLLGRLKPVISVGRLVCFATGHSSLQCGPND